MSSKLNRMIIPTVATAICTTTTQECTGRLKWMKQRATKIYINIYNIEQKQDIMIGQHPTDGGKI